jgi:hypothetical protein
MPASLDQLVGRLKAQSDLKNRHLRIRYNEATDVVGGLGKKIVFRFPKLVSEYLDLSSIQLHFTISTAADSMLDAWSYTSIFQRIRVLSSSTCVLDIDNFGLLSTTLKHAQTSAYVSNTALRRSQGLFQVATESSSEASSARRCFIEFPEGTLLNSPGLLPVGSMNGFFQVELYLQDGNKILYSPGGDAASNYTLSNMQILCNYIRSPSLDSYFAQNPFTCHVNNWSHRFQNLANTQSILRIPSSFTSLRKILLCIRDSNQVNGALTVQGRQQSFCSYNHISSIQLFSNNQPLWSEPIRGENVEIELFNEGMKALPGMAESTYHRDPRVDKAQNGGCPIAISLDSAPQAFRDALISGIRSSQHVSDLYAEIQYTAGITTTTYQADVFLCSDTRIFTSGATGALEIEF